MHGANMKSGGTEDLHSILMSLQSFVRVDAVRA